MLNSFSMSTKCVPSRKLENRLLIKFDQLQTLTKIFTKNGKLFYSQNFVHSQLVAEMRLAMRRLDRVFAVIALSLEKKR